MVVVVSLFSYSCRQTEGPNICKERRTRKGSLFIVHIFMLYERNVAQQKRKQQYRVRGSSPMCQSSSHKYLQGERKIEAVCSHSKGNFSRNFVFYFCIYVRVVWERKLSLCRSVSPTFSLLYLLQQRRKKELKRKRSKQGSCPVYFFVVVVFFVFYYCVCASVSIWRGNVCQMACNSILCD